jgi:cellulose synthase operon protein C
VSKNLPSFIATYAILPTRAPIIVEIESVALELERTSDFDAAKSKLRQLVVEDPSDSIPWLLLELLGHRTFDNALRIEALEARVLLTELPEYRSLLLVDLAELYQAVGNTDRSLLLLRQVADLSTVNSYPALVLGTRFALNTGRPKDLESFLSQRLRLIEDADQASIRGEGVGLPREDRVTETRAYLQLLRALCLRQIGAYEAASITLRSAQEVLPGDLFLLYLRYAEAELNQDDGELLEAGEALGERLVGTQATSCWLTLALNRIGRDDDTRARNYVQQGLKQDTKSLPLRTLDVFLAFKRDDGQSLAIALEALTDCFSDDTVKSSWLLAAASVWALRAQHSIGAKAALAQSTATNLPPDVCHHAGRLLARWVGDPAFYDESTRRAQSLSTHKFDRLDLGLELLRIRLATADKSKIREVITTLLSSEDSAFIGQLAQLTLGRWLRKAAKAPSRPALEDPAFEGEDADSLPPPSSITTQSESVIWDYLADRCHSVEMANALRSVAAVTELVSGDIESATARFDRLLSREPFNLVWAMARITIATTRGEIALATKLIRQTAESSSDMTVRSTLALHGALLGTEAGLVDDVCALLDLAALEHAESVNAFSRWILRTLSLGQPEVRRRILTASETLGNEVRRALERFGFEWFESVHPTTIAVNAPRINDHPPASVDSLSEDGQRAAFALLTLVRSNGKDYLDNSRLPERTRTALSALLAAIRYADIWFKESSPPDAAARLTDARTWAELDPSLLAQLEWLIVARKVGDPTDEVLARTCIATFLGPKEAEALLVGAQQLSYLNGEATPKLLPSTSAMARFANLEVSAPGCDPRRRSTALEEAVDLLGPSSALLIRVNLGFNWITCGDYERARACFTELVEARPRFIPAWLGLKTVAELKNDPKGLAEACAALGDLFERPQQGAVEWERAAQLLLDVLGDTPRGKLALERAVALDITRRDAFTRLFRLVREAGIHPELLQLIDRRLPHVETDEERVLLLWERARTLRTLGNREAALVALDAVTRLAPNHVGALALAGEIHIGLGQFDEAARFLSQLSRLDEAPLKQRLMGAMAAADLFDKKLGRPTFARDILLELYRQGHAPLALRERLAQVAVKAKAPELAVEVLETLFDERPTKESRVEVARLALAICRDKLDSPSRAIRAVDCLLTEIPTDAEALDWVLTGCFPAPSTESWLSDAETHLREALQQTPIDASLLERLARVSAHFDDIRTQQACLGALIAIGEGTQEYDDEIQQLDERLERLPTIAIDEIALEAISAAEDNGPIARLFATFAPVFIEALGPTLQTLGVTKKQRIDPKQGLPLRNEIVAWAGAFGIPEFDLYVTDHVAGDVIALATERPSVVVSARLAVPLDIGGRQAVARELFALRRGLSLLRHRSHHELLALIVAACKLGDSPLQSPPYAMTDEFVRLLNHALPRKLRKTLQEYAASIAASAMEPVDWLRAATHSLDRVAALASGDVSHVLALVSGQRGRLGTSREQRDRVSHLIAFIVSPSYLELKDTLGLCIR